VPGLDYWMTEYCVLGDNEGEIKGEGRDLTIHTALYVARVIHNDLANANASAWHWWLAVSPYDYKDGLVYIDKNKENGSFQTSKMLWALGNFSAFIRPGAVRIELSGLPGNPDLLASSYKNTTGEIVTVLVNSGTEKVNVNLALPAGKLQDVKQYETSADKDLVQTQILKEGNNLTINAKSIVTVIGKIHP
jgi:O-glycosyl hydrolase